jgi:hypothetical protein
MDINLKFKRMDNLLGIFVLGGYFLYPIIIFIMITIIIRIKTDATNKRNQLCAELYVKALEKGQGMPAGLFEMLKGNNQRKQSNPLHNSIICIAVSVGIALFCFLAVDSGYNLKAAAFGIIPFFIGIAYLIIYFIGKKNAK